MNTHVKQASSILIRQCNDLEILFAKKKDRLKHIYHKNTLPPDTSTPSEFTVNVLIIAL